MRNFKTINILALTILLALTATSCRNSDKADDEMNTNKVLLQIDNDPIVAYNIWFKVGSV